MKILVVTTWFPSSESPYSGIFNFRDVVMLARHHELTVVHLTSSPVTAATDQLSILSDRNFELVRLPFTPGSPLSFGPTFQQLKPYLAKADAVHTMAFSALLPFALHNPKLPWVHTEHWSGITIRSRGIAGLRRTLALRFMIRRPRVLVAVSDYLREQIAYLRTKRVVTVGNYVELPSTVEPPELHSQLRLVAVGNLIAHKGPLVALDALRALLDRGIDARLTWVGDGTDRAVVEQSIREHALTDRVTLAGAQSADEVTGFLNAADMFVLPTLSETFGVAIAEATAHGLPVVTGTVGGFRDFLDPLASRVVGERTGAAYAEAIADLWQDSRRPSRAAIAARARELFSEGLREEKYRQAYQLAGAQDF